MAQRKVSFSQGEFYHLYNRGNSKQVIFADARDYDRFMKLLYISNGLEISRNLLARKKEIFNIKQQAPLVAIGAYCLMPNHFHILLTETREGGVSKFMQKLTTGYSMYFNHKYKRTGSLFEGKFKSEHANDDRYLKYLFSYIHMNPIKLIDMDWMVKGIKNAKAAGDYISEYKHSSYKEYLGQRREESVIISPEFFPDYFSNKEAVEKEIFEWITFSSPDEVGAGLV